MATGIERRAALTLDGSDRPLKELVADVGRDVRTLIRQEIALAVLLGTRKRRLYRRAELLQAAGMTVLGAVLTALLRGTPRRHAPVLILPRRSS